MSEPPRILAAMARLAAVRGAARTEVTAAVHELVAAVREILADGDTYLRGLPNLNVAANPYRGLLVRPEPGSRKADRLPPPEGHSMGAEALVLDDTAALVMARRDRAGDYSCRDATDADLRAEDIEPILRTVDRALALHLAAVDGGVARYRKMHDLAAKVRTMLQGAA